MKLIITLLLLLSTILVKGQCEPDRRFEASGTLEFMSDWGFIMQGGITGQQSPVSLHVGIRAREFVDSANKDSYAQAKLFPRLEFGYRIIDGLHVNVGIAKHQDVSITGYRRIGEKVAMYGRALYDGQLVFGLGVKFLIYKN